MNKLIRNFVFVGALLIGANSNASQYVYSYTGESFQVNRLSGATYISASFVTDNLLAPNQTYSIVSIANNFTFSDGVNTILPNNGAFLNNGPAWDEYSWIQTSSSGGIDKWFIVELLGSNRSFVLPTRCCMINDPPPHVYD